MLRTMRSSHSSVVNSVAQLAELVEVERRHLDRRELVDPERVLALGLLVVLEPHVDLRPDSHRLADDRTPGRSVRERARFCGRSW